MADMDPMIEDETDEQFVERIERKTRRSLDDLMRDRGELLAEYHRGRRNGMIAGCVMTLLVGLGLYLALPW